MCYVYIAAEDIHTQPVKIGITRDPARRMAAFNTAHLGEKEIAVRHVVLCPDQSSARSIEQGTLERLRREGVKIKGEVAHCSVAYALGAMTLASQAPAFRSHAARQMDLFRGMVAAA